MKVNFIVEVTDTGFSAYAENFEKYPVGTTGSTIKELTDNIADALESLLDYQNNKTAGMPEITWEYDLEQFFAYHKMINSSVLGDRIGMSKSLLSQYANGKKKASPKQIQRIVNEAIKFGEELTRLRP